MGREDFAPEEGDVVEKKDGGDTRLGAERAGAIVESGDECGENVVCDRFRSAEDTRYAKGGETH